TLPVSRSEGFYRPQPLHTCQPFASQQLHVDLDGNLVLCCQHAGIPSSRTPRDHGGNVAEIGLAAAHSALLGVIHEAQVERVAQMTNGELDDGWDLFPCNACLKRFGKPHWTDDGVGGPSASRQRWKGAWAPRRLPLIES